MAKQEGLGFKELLDAQKRLAAKGDENAKKQIAKLEALAASIEVENKISKQQADTLAKMEKNQDLDKLLQLNQAITAHNIEKDDDAILNDDDKLLKKADELNKIVKKGLLDKKGDGLNSNTLKMFEIVKKDSKLNEAQIKAVLGKSRDTREFKSIGQRVGNIKDTVKDFFSMRGFLDKTGIVKRGTGGVFSEPLDAREARQKKAQARIDSGERGRHADTGKIMNAKESRVEFEKQAGKEQVLRREQGNLERKQTERGTEGGLNERQLSQTPEAKRLNELAKELTGLNPALKDEADELSDQTELLGKIAENTKPLNPIKNNDPTPVESNIPIAPQQDVVNVAPKVTPVSNITGGEKVVPPALPAMPKEDLTEADIENNVKMDKQTDLLTKIEDNTGKSANVKPSKEDNKSEGKKGGMLSGIGDSLKGLGDSAKGLLALAGALWITAKAMQEFAKVPLGGFIKGALALGALVLATRFVKDTKAGETLLALGAAMWILSKGLANFADIGWGSILKGVLALGALGLVAKMLKDEVGFGGILVLGGMAIALWGLSKALAAFADISWGDIAKAGIALTGLGIALFALGSLWEVLTIGIVVLLAAGAALYVFGAAIKEVGEGLDTFANSMKKLGDLGNSGGLLQAALGITAIGAAMLVFGAAQMGTALENLVSNFLSLGEDNPVEQLEKIGKAGPGIEKAAAGMEKLAKAMKTFADIKPDALKGLEDFPWLKATLFAAAGGTMSVTTKDQQIAVAGPGAAPAANVTGKAPITAIAGPKSAADKLADQNGAALDELSDPTKYNRLGQRITTVPPKAANQVYGESAQNAANKNQPAGGASNTTVVNAPTNISKTTQQTFGPNQTRNPDGSLQDYNKRRYSW